MVMDDFFRMGACRCRKLNDVGQIMNDRRGYFAIIFKRCGAREYGRFWKSFGAIPVAIRITVSVTITLICKSSHEP